MKHRADFGNALKATRKIAHGPRDSEFAPAGTAAFKACRRSLRPESGTVNRNLADVAPDAHRCVRDACHPARCCHVEERGDGFILPPKGVAT